MALRRVLLSLVLVLLVGPPLPAAERNVVLFVADDLGKDMGCYGNPVIRTPNMDRLAEEGTLFTHAFATTASCSASRSVILTGLHNHANAHYGHQHHFHHFSSYSWVKSLPVLLGKGGYRTARIGKYHVAPPEVYRFDEHLPGNGRNGVRMADNSREFIGADSDEPFFLYFCTSDPHRGGGTADAPYRPNRFGNLPGGASRPGLEAVEYDPKEVLVPPFLPDTGAARAELAEYYQSVSRVDQGLGRLVEVLREAGVYEDTLIILISDHGIAMPGAKTTVYDPGLNAPCIVRNPYAGERGVTTDAMVSWVDLTPTILDFAGLLDRETGAVPEEIATMPANIHHEHGRGRDTPYRFHGRSFLPILEEESPEGWDRVNASHTFHEITMYYPMRVVRERDWKLIWNIAHPLPYPFASDLWAAPTWQEQYKQGMDAPYGQRTVGEYIHRPEFELYNIENDPGEANNLADDPEHAEVLAEMKRKLREFQEETEDPWIMKWEYE